MPIIERMDPMNRRWKNRKPGNEQLCPFLQDGWSEAQPIVRVIPDITAPVSRHIYHFDTQTEGRSAIEL